MEEKVREWMQAGKWGELYVVCEERRLSWKELTELEDGWGDGGDERRNG